ncbi:MAG: hypothetical protein DI529_11750 [Chryseobacterium sp.]|nr:MAG: hypothetical protein DI529_11750 [Chryseobacterium sp.]
MYVDFYKPQSEILSQYIEGFYFMNKNQTYPFQYFTFPNNFCILSLMNNATLEIQNNEFFIKKSKNRIQISSLTYHYKKQLRINYLGPIEEFTIYFKPNAINNFVENMIDFYHPKSVESFEPFDDFKKLFFNIFKIKDKTLQIDYIETLLLSIFKEKKDSLIENLLIDIEGELSIEKIASKNGISRQYLNQYFKLKIGKSPSEYRKISRFRKSLNLFSQQKKSFTEISYDNLFFDQSHFNRDFKAITNLTPKEFLANTNLDQENIWFII